MLKKYFVFVMAVIAVMMLLACGKKQVPVKSASVAETFNDADIAAATETLSSADIAAATETLSNADIAAVTETFSQAETDAADNDIGKAAVTESAAAENDVDAERETSAEKAAVQNKIDKSGSYYDVENVVLYLHIYGELPGNYITKKEAKALGWEGGSVEQVAPDMAIGGDHYGNYEGKLPEKDGREYKECDIDTHGYKNRGSRRLIYSNDGLYFYTGDHYDSFEELYVTEDGSVERK